MRIRVLMRTGSKEKQARKRKAELQMGGDLFAGFPKEMLNYMFLFLIPKQLTGRYISVKRWLTKD